MHFHNFLYFFFTFHNAQKVAIWRHRRRKKLEQLGHKTATTTPATIRATTTIFSSPPCCWSGNSSSIRRKSSVSLESWVGFGSSFFACIFHFIFQYQWKEVAVVKQHSSFLFFPSMLHHAWNTRSSQSLLAIFLLFPSCPKRIKWEKLNRNCVHQANNEKQLSGWCYCFTGDMVLPVNSGNVFFTFLRVWVIVWGIFCISLGGAFFGVYSAVSSSLNKNNKIKPKEKNMHTLMYLCIMCNLFFLPLSHIP